MLAYCDSKKDALEYGEGYYAVKLCAYKSNGQLDTWWIATTDDQEIDTRGECQMMCEEVWEIERIAINSVTDMRNIK